MKLYERRRFRRVDRRREAKDRLLAASADSRVVAAAVETRRRLEGAADRGADGENMKGSSVCCIRGHVSTNQDTRSHIRQLNIWEEKKSQTVCSFDLRGQ